MKIDFTQLTEREKLIYNQAILNAINEVTLVGSFSKFQQSILTVNACSQQINKLLKK